MGMIIKAAVLGTAMFIGGSAYTAVNSASGDPNLARNSLNFGITQTMGVWGEMANVPANFVEEVKPGLTKLAGQGGALLQTPAPTGRTDQVDPSQQAPAAPTP